MSTTALVESTPDLPTALLIDDEDQIRYLVRKMLEPEICRIVEAPDAEVGLRVLEHGAPQIDLVITDLVMPGLDGLDVLEVLHEHRPTLPVLVTSAFAGSIYPVLNRGERFRILQKPFTSDALKKSVALLTSRALGTRKKEGETRARTTHVRGVNTLIHEHAATLRLQLDLVTAAWAIHRQREAEERNRSLSLY